MTEGSYTTGKAAKAAGISHSMLSWLVAKGLAAPSVRAPRKAGSAALWSEDDVAGLRLMVRARKAARSFTRVEALPPIRLRQLVGNGKAVVLGERGLSTAALGMTLAQLLRATGGGPIVVVPGPHR
jgi:hypothetical protein